MRVEGTYAEALGVRIGGGVLDVLNEGKVAIEANGNEARSAKGIEALGVSGNVSNAGIVSVNAVAAGDRQSLEDVYGVWVEFKNPGSLSNSGEVVVGARSGGSLTRVYGVRGGVGE